MKIEQQVTSLEISKRLKELAVKQEGIFHWFDRAEVNAFKGEPPLLLQEIQDTNPHRYSSFTVAELGEMLPKFFISGKEEIGGPYFCNDDSVLSKITGILTTADTEADARGKMLIYLLENKLI
jgi:hypothetical protein